jgi:3-methyladenine DNA glycosylase AlkD
VRTDGLCWRPHLLLEVDMALRAIGKRNAALRSAAVATAERLAASEDATPRWVGKHALRELAGRAPRR